MYREDLQQLKRKLQEKEKEESAAVAAKSGGRGIRAAAAGRKSGVPEDSLTLEFVHG